MILLGAIVLNKNHLERIDALAGRIHASFKKQHGKYYGTWLFRSVRRGREAFWRLRASGLVLEVFLSHDNDDIDYWRQYEPKKI